MPAAAWEGGVDPATGRTSIGISYSQLCQSVKPGNIILMAGAPARQRGRGWLTMAGALCCWLLLCLP